MGMKWELFGNEMELFETENKICRREKIWQD